MRVVRTEVLWIAEAEIGLLKRLLTWKISFPNSHYYLILKIYGALIELFTHRACNTSAPATVFLVDDDKN